MTVLELTDEQIIEACARFLGWTDCGSGYFMSPSGRRNQCRWMLLDYGVAARLRDNAVAYWGEHKAVKAIADAQDRRAGWPPHCIALWEPRDIALAVATLMAGESHG